MDLAASAAIIVASSLDCRSDTITTDTAWPSQIGVATVGLVATRLTLVETVAAALGLGMLVGWAERRVGGHSLRPMEWNYLTMGIAARVLHAVTATLAAEVDDYRADCGAGR